VNRVITVKMDLDGYIFEYVESTVEIHYDMFRTTVVRPSVLCRFFKKESGIDVQEKDMITILDMLCEKENWLHRLDVVDGETLYECVD
jgi:hypothetical protein